MGARRRRARATLAVAAAVLSIWTGPVHASPHGARIVSIAGCGTQGCAPGDPVLKQGAVVTGTIRITVHAEADLGLEWVRLEAQPEGDVRWYCLEFWNAGRATTFDRERTWNTLAWTDPRSTCAPEACSNCVENSPHRHGALSENLLHKVRVVGREQGSSVSGSEDDESSAFEVRLQNPPGAPAWASDPGSTTSDGRPSVTLQWAPSLEKDVVEYRFVRSDPAGKRTAYAVDAARPGRQGCQKIADLAFRCVDADFGARGGGAYRYQVAAVRRAPSGPACEVVARRCIAGPLGDARTVDVAPFSSKRPSKRDGGPSPGSSPIPANLGGGAPVAIAPPPTTTAAGPTPPVPGTPSSSRAPFVGAAAAILALALGLAAWRERRPGAGSSA
jgi:hypothetical protein